jgi:hypothetical protein
MPRISYRHTVCSSKTVLARVFPHTLPAISGAAIGVVLRFAYYRSDLRTQFAAYRAREIEFRITGVELSKNEMLLNKTSDAT